MLNFLHFSFEMASKGKFPLQFLCLIPTNQTMLQGEIPMGFESFVFPTFFLRIKEALRLCSFIKDSATSKFHSCDRKEQPNF